MLAIGLTNITSYKTYQRTVLLINDNRILQPGFGMIFLCFAVNLLVIIVGMSLLKNTDQPNTHQAITAGQNIQKLYYTDHYDSSETFNCQTTASSWL